MMQAELCETDQVNSFDSNDEREKENCSLFLGDLSIFCDEKDIEEAFAPYGNIVEVRIQRSKETSRALSYGFIEFSCPDSATAALNEMNYFLLKGRPLRIRWAASRTNPIKSAPTPHDSAATVYVRFLTQAVDVVVSEESLRNVFNNYGPVFDCAIKKLTHDQKANRTKGYAFISYDSGVLIQGCVDVAGVDAAYRACNDLRNRVVGNVRYRCEFGNRLQKQYGKADTPAELPLVPVPVPVTVPPMLLPLPLSALPPPISTAYLPPQREPHQQEYAGPHSVTPVSYTVPHNTPMAGSSYRHQQQEEKHQENPQYCSDVYQAPQTHFAQTGYAPHQQDLQQGYASPTFPLSARSTGSMDGSPSHHQQKQMQQRIHPAATPVTVQQHNGYASAPASGPVAFSPPLPLTSACLLQSPQKHHLHHSQQQQSLQTAYQCQIQAQAQAQAQMQAHARAQAHLQQGYGYAQYPQQRQYPQYYATTSSHMYGANSNGGTPTHASTVHTVTPTNYNSGGGMMMPMMMVPVQMSMTPGGQMVYSQQMAHHGERPPQQYLPPQTFQQGTNGKAFTTPQSCSQYFADRGLTLSVSTQSTDEHNIHSVPPSSLSSSSTSMLPPQQQQQGHHGGNSRETTPRSMYMNRNGGGGGGGNNRSNNTSRRNLLQQQQSCYSSSNSLSSSLQSQSGHHHNPSGYGDQHAMSGEVHKPASRRGSNDSIGTINMFAGGASIDECATGDGAVANVDAAGISVDVQAAVAPAESADVEMPTATSTMA